MSGPGVTASLDKEAQEKKDKETAEKLAKEKNDRLIECNKEIMAKSRPYLQNRVPVGSSEGIMESVNYQAKMQPESQAGIILTSIIATILMHIFGTHYWVQRELFKDAQKGKFAYEKNELGNFPPIFQINEKGEPFGEPLNKANQVMPRDLIRQNGYVPEPSYEESWKSTWDTYVYFMSGANSLTDEQKRRTLFVASDVYSKTSHDQRSEAQKKYDANQAASNRPVPPAAAAARSAPSR